MSISGPRERPGPSCLHQPAAHGASGLLPNLVLCVPARSGASEAPDGAPCVQETPCSDPDTRGGPPSLAFHIQPQA